MDGGANLSCMPKKIESLSSNAVGVIKYSYYVAISGYNNNFSCNLF